MIKYTLFLISFFCFNAIYSKSFKLRTEIVFPRDCSFYAHNGKIQNQSDICASNLTAVQKEMDSGYLKDECGNIKIFESAYEKNRDQIRFINIRPGKFIIESVCDTSAYNRSHIYFYYDESIQKPQKRDQVKKYNSPPIIFFPTDPVFKNKENLHWGLAPFIFKVGTRNFDSKTLTLDAFVKGLGDGSTGHYTRYKFYPKTFRPELVFTIIRNREDHKEVYNYEKGILPSGKGWRYISRKVKLKGFFNSDRNL